MNAFKHEGSTMLPSPLLRLNGGRSRGGLARAAEFCQVVGGALRVRGGGEDRPLVVPQNGQPMADIGRVIGTVFEA